MRLAVATAEIVVAVVIAVVVDRIGVELVLCARRSDRRHHASVERAEGRLLDLQRRLCEQADLLRRLDHRRGVIGKNLVSGGCWVNDVGEEISLRSVRCDERCHRADERARRCASRSRHVGKAERSWVGDGLVEQRKAVEADDIDVERVQPGEERAVVEA